jgi:tyrosyl-tRNA synthetase
LLVQTNLASSRSDAARLIEQGAIAVNEERVTDKTAQFSTKDTLVVRRGKRQFAKVSFQ